MRYTAPGPVSHSLLRRYLFPLLAVTVLLYPSAFLIARSQHYEHWAASTWTPMLEYAYDPRPQNADIVIFGDSSAFIGLDPHRINAALGLRSLVLPDSVGSIPVTRDLPLESYLAHNQPPRLLILYFSPWNTDWDRIARYEQFEGQEMLLRHGGWRAILKFGREQPSELLVFPFRLYSTFGPKMLKAILRRTDREQTTERALGHTDYPPFAGLRAGCRIPDSDLVEQSPVTLQALVRRYSTAQTRVLVYLAPVPACQNSAELTERSYAQLAAKPPQTLPPGSFAADRYYAHVLAGSVPAATSQLTDAIRLYLRQHAAVTEGQIGLP